MTAGRSTAYADISKVFAGKNSGLGGTLLVDFGADGSFYVDGKTVPNTVSDGAGKHADCTLSLSLDTFNKMASGKLDATLAFMQGSLHIAGDMSLAMKLGPIIQRSIQ